MKQITLAILIILFLSNCSNQKDKTDKKSDQIAIGPVPDKALSEGSKKQTTQHQSFNKTITNIPQALKQFIPIGYSVLNLSTGDTNLDGLADKILVLKKDDEDATSNQAENKPVKRPLLLLLGKAGGSYKLAIRNDNAVYCIDCGGMAGDPFVTIFTKSGYFSIEHGVAGGEHWKRITIFKYNQTKQTWFLHEEHYTTYKLNDSNNPDAEALIMNTNSITTAKDFGIVPFGSFDVYKEDGE